MSLVKSLFLIAFCSITLLGCARTTVSLKDKVPVGASVAELDSGVRELLEQREAEINSFRALARVALEIGAERKTIRQVIAFERPALLRIESIPLNSAYAFNILVADGFEIKFLDTSEKFAFIGPDTAATVQNLVEIPLEVRALLLVLAGRVPLSRISALGLESFVDQALGHRFILNERAGELYIIDLQSGLLREVWLRDRFSSKLRARLEFVSYEEKNGVQVPVQFRLEIPDKETTMSYELVTFSVNKPLPGKVFTVQVPSDYSRKRME